MRDDMLSFYAFISSFGLYSLLRLMDVWSTKLCVARLDPELHEVNPIAAPLIKKIGFNKTMILTWIPFALVIGFIDAFFLYPVLGIIVLWLFFGLFHLIAAANNMQIYYQVKIFGQKAIEESMRRVIALLKPMSTYQKVIFVIKTNFLNLFLAIYGITTLVLFSFLIPSLSIFIRTSIPALLVIAPPIMVLDLIIFFPTLVFGSLIISMRRVRKIKEQVTTKNEGNSITISLEFAEQIIQEAREKGANYVQLPVPSE